MRRKYARSARTGLAAPVQSAANPTFSLRDEAFNDNIRRDTCMMLSQVQADLRLVTKLLRNTGVFPLEFIGLDVVPFQLVRCLHAHLLTQKYIQRLVIKSVEDAYGPHGTGALQQSLLARLRKPDVFLVAKIMGGTACNFTPAERLFGIYSVGHLAMYAATEDYVPSESPVLKTLVDAADGLFFGTRGEGLKFDTFAILVSQLAAVDSQELFFDVKQLHALVVDKMEAYGRRQEAAWDVLLMAEMRQRAAFRARFPSSAGRSTCCSGSSPYSRRSTSTSSATRLCPKNLLRVLAASTR
jgi:hypothetical protein